MIGGRLVAVRAVAGLVAVLVLCAACAKPPGAPSSQATTRPNASTSDPQDPAPTVGPLFANGVSLAHGCTASVLDSPHGNLILTAAHCVSGTGAGLMFAPGYDQGDTPYDVWPVTHIYADTAWVTAQNPMNDYAILQVADEDRSGRQVSLESVTGGNTIDVAPPNGQTVTVIAYNAGLNDQAVTCDAVVRYQGAYPAFDCPGFTGGSSGARWLTWSAPAGRYVVHAVIGGLNYGGCVDSTSYSSPFGTAVQGLLAQAVTGGAPATMPHPNGDDC